MSTTIIITRQRLAATNMDTTRIVNAMSIITTITMRRAVYARNSCS